MPEAVWALIGVGVGAVIPALTTLHQARKTAEQAEKDRAATSQHANDDRQEARDSRLFDLRREAYVELQSELRRILDWYWAVDNLIGGEVEPRDEDMDRRGRGEGPTFRHRGGISGRSRCDRCGQPICRQA